MCRCTNAGTAADDATKREQGRYATVGAAVFGQVNAAKTCNDQVANDINTTIVSFVGSGMLANVLSGLISSGTCSVMEQLKVLQNGAFGFNVTGNTIQAAPGQSVINGVLYNTTNNLPVAPYAPSVPSQGATTGTSVWDKLGGVF